MKNSNTTTTKFKAVLLLTAMVIMQAQPASASDDDCVTLRNANWQTIHSDSGIVIKTVNCRLFDTPQNISVLAFDPKKFDIAVGITDTLTTTSRMAESLKADYAINGSFFDFAGPALTLVKTPIKTSANISLKQVTRTNWALLGLNNTTSTVQIKHTTCDRMLSEATHYSYAIASYPLLLQNSKIMLDTCDYSHSKFNDRNPRSLVGIDRKRWIVFVAIDGRADGKAIGMTLAEECSVASWMGLTDALNLDGGGSTTLWSHDYNVINYPSDNNTFDHNGERKVSNIIYITRRE